MTDVPLRPALSAEAAEKLAWQPVKQRINRLLTETEKLYVSHQVELYRGKVVDSPTNPTTLSSRALAELESYVQALSNVTNQPDPNRLQWPEKPKILNSLS